MRNRSRSVAFRSRRLSGGAGAWSPADLPGLAAWYTPAPAYCFTDAGSTTPCGDGDPIYTWTDRSGNGYTLSQATLAYRPILYSLGGGLWCATFDGIDDYMDDADSPVWSGAAGGLFGLAANIAGAANQVLGGRPTGLTHQTDATDAYAYAEVFGRYAKPAAGWHRLIAVYDGAGGTDADRLRPFADGAAQTVLAFGGTVPAALGAGTGFRLGAVSEIAFFGGDIGAVVCTEAVGSAGDIALLDDYLSAWAV